MHRTTSPVPSGVMELDFLTAKQRSLLMSKVRGRDTRPELFVRKLCHRLGYRFRLHRRDLPGSPDLVFPRHAKVIFVHGCFWHAHENCPKATVPNSRRDFWVTKFADNRRRDSTAVTKFRALGWKVLVVWECEIRDGGRAERRIAKFLRGPAPSSTSPSSTFSCRVSR